MPLKFTKHALRRMTVRGISEEEILIAIETPEKTFKKNEKQISTRTLAQGCLEVVFEKKDNDLMVITAYWV